jgi:hypothetical protein
MTSLLALVFVTVNTTDAGNYQRPIKLNAWLKACRNQIALPTALMKKTDARIRKQSARMTVYESNLFLAFDKSKDYKVMNKHSLKMIQSRGAAGCLTFGVMSDELKSRFSQQMLIGAAFSFAGVDRNQERLGLTRKAALPGDDPYSRF